jgi:hypothetical protein
LVVVVVTVAVAGNHGSTRLAASRCGHGLIQWR